MFYTSRNNVNPYRLSGPLVSEETIKEQINTVLTDWQTASGTAPARPLRITPLTPDASLRRYFRVTFEDGTSVLAMHFDSLACPEFGSGPKIDSDRAYVELSKFFEARQVAVPRLLFDARERSLLLIEDLGDQTLARLLQSRPPDAVVRKGFEQALDQIIALQSIPPQPSLFAYQRSFTSSLYLKEMSEFLDFVFTPLGPSEERRAPVVRFFENLAMQLAQFPPVLVHRDFHAWNLLLDRQGRIRVIDFQDALLGSRCYDVVSLLNDRDMDSLLGTAVYRDLVRSFAHRLNPEQGFLEEYDRVLLQRDFKVSGRFEKLASQRGLLHYRKWIPGTLRRIGSTLQRMRMREGENGNQDIEEVLDIFRTYLAPIDQGASDPLLFDEMS
jgi:aminoglycoside/choline kinase family phosphotransferase